MSAPTPRPSFWQRRVREPLLAQLTQGTSPDQLALTLGIGATCSLFPFLGFTSLLNLAVGLALRLNQPLLQVLNQLLGPLHLVMILVYIRLGEWLWGAHGDPLTVTEIIRVFKQASLGEFLQRFGWAGIHALTAWLVTAPALTATLYYACRPLLRRFASRVRAGA